MLLPKRNKLESLTQTLTQPLRRKKKEVPEKRSKLTLEHVIGTTTNCKSGLANHPTDDIVAYLAGCVLVLYHTKKNKQIAHLSAQNPYVPLAPLDTSLSRNSNSNMPDKKEKKRSDGFKSLTCVDFSPDGNYVAAGEMGHQPRILIWDISTQNLVAELQSHKFGVLSLAFSPNGKYLVSVGFQHDGYLYVWNWKSATKLASNKITTKVYALAFAKDGSFCVTTGLRFVKFWYFDSSGNLPLPKSGLSNTNTVRVLDGRPGILGDHKGKCFTGVSCGTTPPGNELTYVITSKGYLCVFTKTRLLDRWIDLQVKNAYSVQVTNDYVICGCSDGIVRLFEPVTLKYIGTLPKPFASGLSLPLDEKPTLLPDDTFPDSVAAVGSAANDKIVSVYSDRSMIVWNVKDTKKIVKIKSFLPHSDVVWGVELIPKGAKNYPVDSFMTYSADGTVRCWNFNEAKMMEDSKKVSKHGSLCRELLQIAYLDEDWAQTQEPESSSSADSASLVGPRSLKISADGKFLATGDRLGNLRLQELSTFNLIAYHEAHDSEVLSLDFSISTAIENSPMLLATGSRDRLLHIFDLRNNCQLLQTLDDHSASITSIKFSESGCKLISCGPDKSIIFRACQEGSLLPYFNTYQIYSDRLNIYELDLDSAHSRIVTVTQDRKVNIHDIINGKIVKSHPLPSTEESLIDGSLIHISLDNSCSFAVTAGTDKRIRMHDLDNGNCIASVGGHSELITAVKFTTDCRRIISTSGDSCIFVWRLEKHFAAVLVSRKAKLKAEQAKLLQAQARNASSRTKAEVESPKITAIVPETVTMRRDIKSILKSRDSAPRPSVDETGTSPQISIMDEIALDEEALKEIESTLSSFEGESDVTDFHDEEGEEALSDCPSEENQPLDTKEDMNFSVKMTPQLQSRLLNSIDEDTDEKEPSTSNNAGTTLPLTRSLSFDPASGFDDYITRPLTFTPSNRNSITANFLLAVKGKEQEGYSHRRRRSVSTMTGSFSSQMENFSEQLAELVNSPIDDSASPKSKTMEVLRKLSCTPPLGVDAKEYAKQKLMGGTKLPNVDKSNNRSSAPGLRNARSTIELKVSKKSHVSMTNEKTVSDTKVELENNILKFDSLDDVSPLPVEAGPIEAFVETPAEASVAAAMEFEPGQLLQLAQDVKNTTTKLLQQIEKLDKSARDDAEADIKTTRRMLLDIADEIHHYFRQGSAGVKRQNSERKWKSSRPSTGIPVRLYENESQAADADTSSPDDESGRLNRRKSTLYGGWESKQQRKEMLELASHDLLEIYSELLLETIKKKLSK